MTPHGAAPVVQTTPQEMRQAKRWILWRPVPAGDKVNKVPLDPFTGKPFETGSGYQTDPSRWASFEQLNGSPKGFVLGDGWAGVDIDGCIKDGKREQWVIDLVSAMGTYAEVSPSGTGVKVFMRATRPAGAESVRKCAAWNFEIYSEKRYFTVTGNRLPEAPAIIAERTAQLQRITEAVWGGDLVNLSKLRGLFLSESGPNVHIRCPWQAEHTHGQSDKDAALHVKDGKVVGFHCFHSHCSKRTLRDVRRWFGVDSLDHPLTEAGDAECFADLYQDRIRYDHRRGRWLVSDDASGIWVPDPVERLTQMTVEMMRARQRQALSISDADLKKRVMKWAIDGEARRRVTNAIALARSVPPIADPGDNWDRDPFLLGVQNGVVDLRTGQFRKATADDRVTMRVRVPYDPAATCPLWVKTVGEIFGAYESITAVENEMVTFMQRALGYSITGDCREECCFFPWGDGCNGKGTLMNTLGWLLDDYADDMPYSTLEQTKYGGGIPNDVAKLDGKRFVTCSEVNEFHINESRLKALTGRDPITARFLHREFFTFIPVSKIWVSTNNKPKIVGQDDGVWRRIHLIPFTVSFEGRENKSLKDQLRGELPGILNWLIEGARLWLRDGLNPPAIVKAATAEYRQESNPITPFIDSRCVVGAGLRMQASLAFKEYEQFCRDENIPNYRRMTNKAFYKAIEDRFEADRSGRQTFYLGAGLIERQVASQMAPPQDARPEVDDSMAANPEETPF